MRNAPTLSLVLVVALGLTVLAGVLLIAVWPAHAQGSGPELTTSPADGPLARPQDPVVLTGADLPTFLNQPIAELKLYAYDGVAWAPLPFQVDEVCQGQYVAPGDDPDDGYQGLLDADDQLVFMGNDAGQAAGCDASLRLVGSSHDRQTIAVTDTLNGDTGLVYLFRSTALPASSSAYVDWNDATQTMTGTYHYAYVATFGGTSLPPFPGLADLSVNGSADVLDRQKLVVSFSGTVDVGLGCGLGLSFACTINEQGDYEGGYVCEVFASEWDDVVPFDVHFPAVGPVRAVNDWGMALYGSRLDLAAYVPFDLLEQQPRICPGTVEVQLARIALDLNNPADTGIDTYYNSNGSVAAVDGVPDAVATTPLIDWQQTSGGAAGGYMVAWRDVTSGTGNGATYYLDDSEAGGTGDGSSYGEAGFEIINSDAALLGAATSIYILPPATDANVGATYWAYATTPLSATATSEFCELVPVHAEFTAWPTAGVAPLQVSFSNSSTGAVEASTWAFGDGVTSTLPSPTHTYQSAGFYTVVLTVTGPGGSDTEVKAAYIAAERARFRFYLPLVMRLDITTTLPLAPWFQPCYNHLVGACRTAQNEP